MSRRNTSVLVNLFLLMMPAGMPELASREDINYLREMLAPQDTDAAVCLQSPICLPSVLFVVVP
jgi:hypothetical protein